MKILITNTRLAKRTGTELYVFELALELLRRGHRPVVYSPRMGRLAQQLMARTVPVVDQLGAIGSRPDVIHGHHHDPTLCAALRFSSTPVVFCCHSWNSSQDQPPALANIRRYVAVDQTCYDRLTCQFGLPEARCQVVHNFANLERFRPRGPLPAKPRRALLFTNRASWGVFRRQLQAACHDHNLELAHLGSASGGTEAPEDVLGEYDLVFARAKAAIEAMAVGTAVILCDRKGLGPMVTPNNFDALRELNFGRRALDRPVNRTHLGEEIAKYHPLAARSVSQRVRNESSLGLAVDQWLALYAEVQEEMASDPCDPQDQLAHAAEVLERNLAQVRPKSGLLRTLRDASKSLLRRRAA